MNLTTYNTCVTVLDNNLAHQLLNMKLHMNKSHVLLFEFMCHLFSHQRISCIGMNIQGSF